MKSSEKFGQQLTVMRKQAGLTNVELGKLVGVSEAAIRRFQKGQLPRLDMLESLAEACGGDPADFGELPVYQPEASRNPGWIEFVRSREGQETPAWVLMELEKVVIPTGRVGSKAEWIEIAEAFARFTWPGKKK